jgi:HD-like signal output (HDOD) protein
VAFIGSKEISALGMGIVTMKLFKDIPQEIIDLKQFFKHSLACGVLSRLLAAHMNVQNTEQLFVAGLLHDVGRVILFKYFPQLSKASLFEALDSGDLLYNTESNYFGCRHTHIGKDLFHQWKLPYSLENSTYYHHQPSRAPDSTQPAIVHLADFCAHCYGLGASGETRVPSLDKAAVEDLPFAPGMLKNVMTQGLRQLNYFETVLQDEG